MTSFQLHNSIRDRVRRRVQHGIRTARARLHMRRRRTHGLSASLTVLSLVVCTLAVFLLSVAGDRVQNATAEIVQGLGSR